MNAKAYPGAVPASLLFALLAASASRDGVTVEDSTGCLPPDTRERLATVWTRAPHPRPDVFAVVRKSHDETRVLWLRIVGRDGTEHAARRIELAPADCPEAPSLLAAILERQRKALPTTGWPPPPAPTLGTAEWLFAASLRGEPASADAETSLRLELGRAHHRLAGDVTLRVGLPQRLGEGHVADGMLLLGAGWRYLAPSWRHLLAARTGGVWTAGLGFVGNRTVWLPWVEAHAELQFRWRSLWIGPNASISPVRHQIRTVGGRSTQLPWFRLGLTLAVPIWEEKI